MEFGWWGLLIALFMFVIAYIQMKIASAKIKLELYNKRFAVYESILELYQYVLDWDEEKIKPRMNKFIKAYRESKFLFDEKDGIYDLISEIHAANGKMQGFHNYLKEERIDSEVRMMLHKGSIEGFDIYSKKLIIFEDKLKKYLEFKSVEGYFLIPLFIRKIIYK